VQLLLIPPRSLPFTLRVPEGVLVLGTNTGTLWCHHRHQGTIPRVRESNVKDNPFIIYLEQGTTEACTGCCKTTIHCHGFHEARRQKTLYGGLWSELENNCTPRARSLPRQLHQYVWFNTHSLANILSMAEVRKVCYITMDSSIEPALTVHRHDGSHMKFVEYKSGLYFFDTATLEPSNSTSEAVNDYLFYIQ
jgi:hypothetical protein